MSIGLLIVEILYGNRQASAPYLSPMIIPDQSIYLLLRADQVID
jgi:hypothetical protein